MQIRIRKNCQKKKKEEKIKESHIYYRYKKFYVHILHRFYIQYIHMYMEDQEKDDESILLVRPLERIKPKDEVYGF